MLNLDMVGRLQENRLTVFGTRSSTDFSGLVSADAAQLGLTIRESDDVGRSDHMSFYQKKIPVLHFFTGVHGDYHRPTDTWEKLNIDGMAKVSDLVLLTALQLADAQQPIGFVSLPSRPPESGVAGGQGFAPISELFRNMASPPKGCSSPGSPAAVRPHARACGRVT